jgi:hypothetical protein
MAGRVATGEFVSREQVRVPGKCPMVEPLDVCIEFECSR